MGFRVSVITPVFNAERYIAESVRSASAIPEVEEILLVNDCGPDRSWEICQQLKKDFPKVRLLEHSDGRNHGAGASRNLGILNARCEYVSFLDADDWYLSTRFEADREILLRDPRVDGVYNALGNWYESESLRELWLAQGRPELMTLSAQVSPEELYLVLLHSHPLVKGEFSTDTITVRRSFFSRCGYFHTKLRLQQDTHLWKRMSVAGRLAGGNLLTPVAIRRVHPDNRMTRLADHAQYMEIWYVSLFEEFKKLGAEDDAVVALLRGFFDFQVSQRNHLRAFILFCRWYLRNPQSVMTSYGHFDQMLRQLFGSYGGTDRLLSFKNRLVRALID